MATAAGELKELANQGRSRNVLALVNNLLVGSSVAGGFSSEAMGEGVGIDKCHCMKEEAPEG